VSADERRRVRQDKSKPLVAALKTWLEHQLARVSTKAPIADETRYGLNHWDGLTRFLDDPWQIELSKMGQGLAGAHRCRPVRLHSAGRRHLRMLVRTQSRESSEKFNKNPPTSQHYVFASAPPRHQQNQ
jgi:hypothetical protein